MMLEQEQVKGEEDRRPANGGGIARATSVAFLISVVLLLAGLLWRGVASAQLSAAFFSYPFQFDESESMIVAETLLLDRGVNIFERPGPELFISAPYPPLFYLLGWPLQHLVGEEPTFKIGRALSILSTLLAGAAIFGVIVALTRDRLAGALGATMWWALGLVAFWGSLVKPDMLALALGLAGIWWLVARPHEQVWWALPFFLGAFFTKQTAIAAVVAAVGWLLLTRPRVGLAFGAAYAGAALGLSLLLNLWTSGGYFYHMFTLHDLPWFGDRFMGFIGGFVGAYGAFVVPGIAAIVGVAVAWLYGRGRREGQILPHDGALLLFFYLGMSAVAASGTGTLGGNHNHLLELSAASSLGLGVGAGVVRRVAAWPARALGAGLALLLVAQVPTLFATPRWLGLELREPPASYTEGMTNVFQYVTNNSGEAYSDNVGLLLAAGKKLWTTDPFTQTHATYYGRWDESKLVEAIRSRRFSQMIFRIDVFAEDAGAGDISPGILQAVRDNYKLDQDNVEYIYVPR